MGQNDNRALPVALLRGGCPDPVASGGADGRGGDGVGWVACGGGVLVGRFPAAAEADAGVRFWS